VSVADTGVAFTGSGDATRVPVITAFVELVTALVMTLKVCETLLPAFTITSVDTRVAEGSEDDRLTAMFCVAAALSVTCPVTIVPLPPTVVVGVSVTDAELWALCQDRHLLNCRHKQP